MMRAAAAKVSTLLLAGILLACNATVEPFRTGDGADAKTGLKDKGVRDIDSWDGGGAATEAGIPDPPDTGFADVVLPDAVASPDRDRDGLPNEEDPDPDTPNALLFADTFETARREWLFTTVGMEIDTQRSLLRVPQVEPLVREGWLGPRSQWGDLYIRGLLRVNAIGTSATSGTGRVGLLGRTNQVAPDRYLLCGLDLKTNVVFVTEHAGGAPAGKRLASAAATTGLGTWAQYTFDIHGSHLECTVGETTVTARSTLYISGSAGFRSFDVAFDADWFEVYDR